MHLFFHTIYQVIEIADVMQILAAVLSILLNDGLLLYYYLLFCY